MIVHVDKFNIGSTWMMFERDLEVETGKTQVWNVYSRKGIRLGQIRWFGRWRAYSFFPFADSVFNTTCLRDIQDVITGLMIEWRQERKFS